MSLALVVDAELFRLDSVIRWLDAAEGRIRRAALADAGPDTASGPQTGTQDIYGIKGTQRGTPGALPSVRRRVGVRK